MKGGRTPTWWILRFQLAVGVGMTPLVWRFAIDQALTVCFCGGQPYAVMAIAAIATAVAGLVWMVRIIRGPSESLPAWRYRDL